MYFIFARWPLLRLGVTRAVRNPPSSPSKELSKLTKPRVSVIDPSVGSIITHLPAANVYDLGFSPLGNYIITWQRPTKDENGDADKNLKVWKTVDAHASQDVERIVVGQFVQKSQTGWNLQYTSDERFCARLVTNEIQFYESSDLSTVWNKLRVEGVSDFAVSRGKDHSVAVFVPERKVRDSVDHTLTNLVDRGLGRTCSN